MADSNPDAVKEAREIDGWAILAMPPSFGMPNVATFDGARRIDQLLKTLADEVEQLCAENKQLKKCDHCERGATQTVCDLNEGR